MKDISKFPNENELQNLKSVLIHTLYGEDKSFIKDGKLIGFETNLDDENKSKSGLGLLGKENYLAKEDYITHHP